MIYQQSVFDPWPIESETVQAVICSPPYFALRKYSIPDVIIGGDKDCKHEFKESLYIRNNDKTASKKQQSNTGSVGRDEPVKHGFCTHCNACKGQYGLEPTPQMYVEHTRLWAKEAWRVLRNDGIFFLNIADSYAGSGGAGGDYNKGGLREGQEKYKQNKINYPSKCQLLIPHRVAIALVDDGWTLRNTIVWHSTNKMPESVTDRFSKKYEYVYLFTKPCKTINWWRNLKTNEFVNIKPEVMVIFQNQITGKILDVLPEEFKHLTFINEEGNTKKLWKRKQLWQGMNYYFDLDSVREKCPPLNRWGGNKLIAKGQSEWDKGTGQITYRERDMQPNDGMKNPGDVWQIPTQPSSEKHFAMWPERLVERMVKCSTKAGDTVLDCFAGTGTTLKVAEQLQRKGVGIDLGYHEISKRRTSKIQKQLFV